MLSDLIFVLRYIKSILDESGLPDAYHDYEITLNKIATASTPELQTELSELKKKIKDAHEKLNPKEWSYSQLKIFNKLGAESVLGQKGWDNFNSSLVDNSANVPGAVEALEKQKTAISQILTNVNNIFSSLGELVEEMEVEPGQSVIQIVFDEKVSVETLVDLSDKSEEWREIIRAYSLLAHESPDNTKIIATSKGSPYILWLKTAEFIGVTICATIKPFLELYKGILELKKSAISLNKAIIENKTDEFKLFEKIDEYERKRVMAIIDDVSKLNNKNGISDGDRNEAKNALNMAGPKLYVFIKDGGKVDTSKQNEERKVFSNFQFESNYKEVYRLRDEVQTLLEAGKTKQPAKPLKVEVVKPKTKRGRKSAKPNIQKLQSETSNTAGKPKVD